MWEPRKTALLSCISSFQCMHIHIFNKLSVVLFSYNNHDKTFSDISGVAGITDDIIVVGYKSDGSDHDANLTAVLERARATGLCFNDKNMVVRCKRIPFFGNIIGADGIEPDPEKVTAICHMTAPTDVKELQTCIGLANYLGRFTPHLATYSVSATQRFLRDERSLRLGTITRCCIFKLEEGYLLK